MQARGEAMDGGAVARDVPPLLRPCGDAHLCRQHGGEVQLEQEGVWHGAGQLLLGILLHPGVRRLRQRPVRHVASARVDSEKTGVSILLVFSTVCCLHGGVSDGTTLWL